MSTAPRAELAAVGANTSVGFDLFGHSVESQPSAVPGGHDVEVVEVGEEELVVLQARAGRNERVVQAESEESWHERIPLLAAFPLENVVGGTIVHRPKEAGLASVVLANERS